MKKTTDKFPVTFSVVVFAISMPVLWGTIYPLLINLPAYLAGTVSGTVFLVAVHSVYVIFGILMLKDKKQVYGTVKKGKETL